MKRSIGRCAATVVLCACVCATIPATPTARGAVVTDSSTAARATASSQGADSLEAAATKAANIGRAVAMSLIGLALAVSGVVLVFRRDFKEAAGVLAVGLVAVLLATPAGVGVLRDTVASLFGGQ